MVVVTLLVAVGGVCVEIISGGRRKRVKRNKEEETRMNHICIAFPFLL
jgi:hypothetical protein